MIQIRKASDRGHHNAGWLDSFHTFSFGRYYDHDHMGFRCLRVINEDRVEPGKGFGTHPHDNMEIISYVVSGELEHKDSLGTGSVIRPGDVQRISAGTGVQHSELNPSQSAAVHFLQIWIVPDQMGVAPSYDQRHFPLDSRRNKLALIASPIGDEGSIQINQDVRLFSTILDDGRRVELKLEKGRYAWIQLVRGELDLNGIRLQGSDGAALSGVELIELNAVSESEVLIFDLP